MVDSRFDSYEKIRSSTVEAVHLVNKLMKAKKQQHNGVSLSAL